MNVEPIASVDDLVVLLAEMRSSGDDELDQLAHGLQCAFELRQSHPHDPELQVAGLVHDIGHVVLPNDDRVNHDLMHGVAGGLAVRNLLGRRVAALVELHVLAKRYLVSVELAYSNALSPVSTVTLANQGGPMTPREIEQFEALPEFDAAVALRRADEAAKVRGRRVPGLGHWRPVLETLTP